MTVTNLKVDEAKKMIAGGARLVDIRDPDEHARERIPGAINVPLTQIQQLPKSDGPTIFHCRSGMRTLANSQTLAAASADAPCYLLTGGIEAWRGAGLPTSVDRNQPLEVMRQVQLAAGGLVVLGIVLGFLFAPAFYALSAFVGAGLMFAGATGWCGMARLLMLMPWNRSVAPQKASV